MQDIIDIVLKWAPIVLGSAVAALVVIAPATKTKKDDKVLGALQWLLEQVGKLALKGLLPTKGAKDFAKKELDKNTKLN